MRQIALAPNFGVVLALAPSRQSHRRGRGYFRGQIYGKTNLEFVLDGLRSRLRSVGSLAMDGKADLRRLPVSIPQNKFLSWLD
jgi:hypothetical protein